MSGARQQIDRVLSRLVLRARARRALATAVAVLLGGSIVAIAIAVARLSGWIDFTWPRWSPGVAAVLLGAAVAGAFLWRLAPAAAAREADRRLGLDELFVTALEVRDDTDPLCRAIERRAATTLSRARLSRALPVRPPAAVLLIPALAILAVGLNASAVDRAAGRATLSRSAEAAELSRLLQDAASRILSQAAPEGTAPITDPADLAREVLDVDAALRAGDLDVATARAAIERVAAALEEARRSAVPSSPAQRSAPPGDEGPGSDAVAGWIETLQRIAAAPDVVRMAADRGGGRSGGPDDVEIPRPRPDEGAGRGVVPLAVEPARPVPPVASAAWTIPQHPDDRRQDEAGDEAGGPLAGSADDLPLTRAERETVERYRRALEREHRRRAGDTP